MKTRIVVLGDSLSDFGNKKDTAIGRFARSANLMRTNEVGRYSDGENFADIIWKLTGGEPLIQRDRERTNELTRSHMSLENSTNGSPDGISFVNYAVGGEVTVASSNPANKLGLTTIGEQKRQYIKELDAESINNSSKPETALHIIWTGLNDTVTDGKGPEEMLRVIDKIDQITQEIRERVGRDGTKAEFLLINNPNPQEAVRFSKNPNDRKVLRAKEATEEFNRLLQQRFEGVADTAIVDTSQMFNSNSLHQFNILKASQNHGVPVEYEMPYRMDSSLGNVLAEFRDTHLNTAKGREIFSQIRPFLQEAFKTDDEVLLHRKVGNIVLTRIRDGDNSEETKAIKEALLATGTFVSKVDFATQYYQTIHNSQKHSEDIDRIQTEIDKIYSEYEAKPKKQLRDDLNNLNDGLYKAVEETLVNSKSKNSTYRELIQEVAMHDFGFVATSDKVHPTAALNNAVALMVADAINNNFPETLGSEFKQNTQLLYGNRNFTSNNPLNSLEENLSNNRSTQTIDMQRFTQPINKEKKVKFDNTVDETKFNKNRSTLDGSHIIRKTKF